MYSQSASVDSKSPKVLLHKLCSKITGVKDDAVAPYYRMALATLGSNFARPPESDEFEVAEKIKRKLARQGREREAAVFCELHRKFQSQELLRNRWAVLYLLHRLNDESAKNKSTSLFMQGLAGAYATSTPFLGRPAAPSGAGEAPSTGGSTTRVHASSTLSSGISTIPDSFQSGDPSPMPHSLAPSYLQTPAATRNYGNQPQSTRADRVTLPTGLRLMQAMDTGRPGGSTDLSVAVRGDRSVATAASYKLSSRKGDNTSFELPETRLLREIVYVFQGIDGKYIKFEVDREGFRIDPKIGIPRSVRKVVGKLAECGWMYSKVRKYADSRSTDRAFGLVGQSFCAALHQELMEYYRLMAVLEAQLQQEEDEGISIPGSGLTLRRLNVWTIDPLVRLKTLAALVDVCQGKKGGALASAIHSYLQHGDPAIRSLVKHTLTLVAQPIFSTIIRWIYDGELEDIYHEFFVASDPMVKDDRLWHDKYSLRKSMIPSFLTMDQAKKILLTGKSINFLRQVCQDRTIIRNRDVIKAADTIEVESIFTQDLDGVFQKMIDTVYKETSQHLLEVLHLKYKFMDHLKAMRRYLLLGQGDFIRHLMDLLEEDLAKPAQALFLHNLTGILETAIRATNAQYDDADILKRLDVRLLEVSPGESGWDVFSLDYHVDGPIRTVFTPACMIYYLRVFNFLWRAKRMEYILAGIWKVQMTNALMHRTLPELSPVVHQCHMICSEMVHFIQQVQYYINFEVLECSWDELLKKVQCAEDLDHMIAAHQEFLDTIIARSLLDNQSTAILTQLRTIFDLIIQFQSIQDQMYHSAAEELLARQCFEDKKKHKTAEGDWGVTDEEVKQESRRKKEFSHAVLRPTKSQLIVLGQSYQNMVQQFLLMLTGHTDVSLRFLSFRLDFNEHYRAKEPKLRTPKAYNRAKKKSEKTHSSKD